MLMRFICWGWLLALLPLAAAAQTPAMSHLRGQLRLARTDTAQLRPAPGRHWVTAKNRFRC